jgi:hypothetical protein
MFGFCVMVTPGKVANKPVIGDTATPSALNELSLKPSTTTQNAFDHVPPDLLMTSCTSSLPKVSLFAQNPAIASGNGLSVGGAQQGCLIRHQPDDELVEHASSELIGTKPLPRRPLFRDLV